MAGLRVVVAVATYQRPHLLTILLPKLVKQAEALRHDTRVVVVDNDPARSAQTAVAAIEGAEYISEPRPGIAAARNRALEAAQADDVLVFIDDDELPTPGWLDSMVGAWQEWGCAAVAGPVVSSFESPVDAWVAACSTFKRPRRPSGTVLGGAATNNLLLDLAQLRAMDLRFDDRFGLTGGSDTMLTHTLVSRGGRIRWCDEAVMTEAVPADRATRTWALARSRRTGNVWSRVKLELAPTRGARHRARTRLVAVALHRMVTGLFLALRGRITGDVERRVAGELDLAQGRGVVEGAWGAVVAEYVRDSST